jgi:hypothetical protein
MPSSNGVNVQQRREILGVEWFDVGVRHSVKPAWRQAGCCYIFPFFPVSAVFQSPAFAVNNETNAAGAIDSL